MQSSEKKISEFKILDEDTGSRLDQFISQRVGELSRSRAAKFIKDELILVNEKARKPSYLLELNDSIRILWPEKKVLDLEPWEFALDIVHEDDDLIVLNKPAGLVMHPSVGHESKTLVHALIHHCKELSMGYAEHRPGIVHRLDKDTSGLIVAAKNDQTHQNLAEQFQSRTVVRSYIALVHGVARFEQLKVDNHLARHNKDRKRYASTDNFEIGKRAITNFELIETINNQFSLLQCKLETGRTHQIRVHTSELHHPILGDEFYGSKKRDSKVESAKLRSLLLKLNRVCLHAYELGFTHPSTQEKLMFKIDWPKDLLSIKEQLKIDSISTIL